MANKITDGKPSKAKLGIFIEEQGATSVESLWKAATIYKSLKTTDVSSVFNNERHTVWIVFVSAGLVYKLLSTGTVICFKVKFVYCFCCN